MSTQAVLGYFCDMTDITDVYTIIIFRGARKIRNDAAQASVRPIIEFCSSAPEQNV